MEYNFKEYYFNSDSDLFLNENGDYYDPRKEEEEEEEKEKEQKQEVDFFDYLIDNIHILFENQTEEQTEEQCDDQCDDQCEEQTDDQTEEQCYRLLSYKGSSYYVPETNTTFPIPVYNTECQIGVINESDINNIIFISI